MNPRLEHLHQYPFERLNALLSKVKPNPELAEAIREADKSSDKEES